MSKVRKALASTGLAAGLALSMFAGIGPTSIVASPAAAIEVATFSFTSSGDAVNQRRLMIQAGWSCGSIHTYPSANRQVEYRFTCWR